MTLELIALKKELFDFIKRELGYIGLLFLLALLAFKIAFFKESLPVLFRNVLALFWMFALPGYFIMLYWKDELGFIERFIVGIGLSAGIIGIFSYYLGLMGLNIKYHTIALPLAIILASLAIALRKK